MILLASIHVHEAVIMYFILLQKIDGEFKSMLYGMIADEYLSIVLKIIAALLPYIHKQKAV